MLEPNSHPLHGGWPCWLTSNKQNMQKWSHNCLLPFWALFLLWTTHCEGSSGHMVRTPWSPAKRSMCWGMKVPAYSQQETETCSRWACGWAILEMGPLAPGKLLTVTSACVLPWIPGETLNQNHLAKTFPDSLLSENVWDKHLLF